MSRTNWKFPRRQARKKEAAIRQEEYDGMSTDAKIYQAVNRRGISKKELIKLGVPDFD